MEGNREKEHLVALKVMRLTKPSLMMTAPVLCGEQDLPQDSLLHTLQHDLAVVHGLENLALGELLTLPQNFGNIFLGETFSSYISVHNDSTQMCRDLLVKADLQTSSQRLTLSGASAQILPQLPPDASVDDVIHHEVKELGTHILVCAVSYTTQSGEKMYFRKFFKFQVLKPLDVKTKFYNAESDEVYLEAQIQNITPGPIFMERVNLDPSAQYTVAEINSTTPKDRDHSVFGKVPYMCPMDVRQYLYCLSPKPEVAADPRILKGVTNIGKLDIMWKTNMGEKGRLQTSALQRVAPGYGDIRLCIEELCDSVPVEKIFNLKVKVTNCSERNMDLQLILRDTSAVSGLHWCGVSGRHLPSLLPNATTILPLTLLPLHTGLLTISGLQLTDPFLKRTYEHDDLAQVFVYDEAEP